MAIDVDVAIRNSRRMAADYQAALELIQDWPRSVGLFPELKSFDHVDDGVYRWEMNPIGAAGIEHTVVFGARFDESDGGSAVVWSPAPDIGNSRIAGRLAVAEVDSGIEIGLDIEGQIGEIPVPFILRRTAVPLVRGTFEDYVRRYLERLETELQ